MGKRINIVLPEATIRTIDRMAKPGQRSHFIENAVQHFVAHRSAEALRALLEHTAIRDLDLDREVNADWIFVDRASWHNLESSEYQTAATPKGAKSTSRRSIPRSGAKFRKPARP
jgi:hypothetical protein